LPIYASSLTRWSNEVGRRHYAAPIDVRSHVGN
jgi:hypothetical protein